MEKAKVLIISSDKHLSEVLDICFRGWGYAVFLQDLLANDITPIKKTSPDVIVIDVHSANKAQLEICRLLKNDFITAFIPIITLINKRQLKMQLLNLKHGVDDYLIKPPDPLDLRVRVEMALRRSQYSFYASPLTGLPGGRIIEEVLRDRLAKNLSFSFGYLDIDNFKYFNDTYGYIKGDRVITQTAYLLYTTIRKFGNSEDFIGHIGGDDFVFITTPDKYPVICDNFIRMFEKVIPFHYSADDRQRGFILAKDRTRQTKKISLMSISVAVVNRDTDSPVKSIIEINERITEVKRYLKNISGSKFMAERREVVKNGDVGPRFYKREEGKIDNYKPLGQILVEKGLISAEQLDEALNIHWRRGVIFGEILKELGFISEKDLVDIVKDQEFAKNEKKNEVFLAPEKINSSHGKT
jgi:diguanylate cyclase (GGDEF)-like protein